MKMMDHSDLMVELLSWREEEEEEDHPSVTQLIEKH